ncbi:MAG: cysteine desulfurase [Candidatus Melainabacteria bacterium]|nr:cysteine desulfurase [Candidatus Melainabacteria bacterium]
MRVSVFNNIQDQYLRESRMPFATRHAASKKAARARPSTIYMDYAASTPVDPAVLEVVMETLSASPGNPHSRQHAFGASASRIVEAARQKVALATGAEAGEIFFTSGATEANNIALLGLRDHLERSGRKRIITSAVEHKSVLEPLGQLARWGFEVVVLPVKPCGMLEASAVERYLDERTGLVSVQAVNNEIGVIQPVSEIAAVLAGRDVLLHCDASQALGKIDLDVKDMGVDLASFSAHKAYGPQGVGALFVGAEARSLLSATDFGGGQEKGLRPGTVPVALCAGFGAACDLAAEGIADERWRLFELREAFLSGIARLSPVVHGHSDPAWNVPGILSLRFAGIDSETLLMALPMVAISTGSACGSPVPGESERNSHVIEAVSGSPPASRETIRLSFGRFTTVSEVELAAEAFVRAVEEIREIQGGLI